MTDEEFIFRQISAERKRIGRGDFNKKRKGGRFVRLPSDNLTKKFRCSNLRLSVFARNPFYVYKNMPIFDVEASDATNWIRQSVLQGTTASTRTFGFSLRASF